jgi:uncharacterized protein YndB with AHSA1/START domain
MTQATLHADGRVASVRLERHLVDPPDVVWSAITDRDELRSWFPCDVEVVGGTWRVGAAIVFRFSPAFDMTLDGEVLAVEEARLLRYSWGEDTLCFELVAEGSGTRLTLTDELPPGSAARNAAGWEECLARLDGQPSAEDGSWKASFEKYSAEFSPLLGAQEGPPEGHQAVT